MKTYQGVCKYCGNIQPVMASTQEEADEIVSGKCDCGVAKTEEKKTKLMERINYIAAAAYNETFESLPQEQVEMLRQAGKDVLNMNCTSVTFDVMDSKIRIWRDGDKIKVKRSGNREETAEA